MTAFYNIKINFIHKSRKIIINNTNKTIASNQPNEMKICLICIPIIIKIFQITKYFILLDSEGKKYSDNKHVFNDKELKYP